ncbi:aminotransferase class I/II-fold pyridoxal phosphate-dependent enzyme [Streptomyces sp. ST2-7A]|uniref:aminotransferase class I/II-fold pyridoxal phosphate-dependent enzyme n=1 Tax=Streptomyces sp. ST2-7A TaxID=2907214 RepID=UPI001F300BDE|nr:aminotransferase class I/II-fold pyridoxal phosphate-dependent enzyme [Streptomyces sp. ST2-7A]MCE7080330.1 aminotransferase class I/II-fold pyridoxal phosphate-dependent enzyme [Streptomyces sp. ST2-7A]
MIALDNLTKMEVAALTDVNGGLNLTDGHARLTLSARQAEVIARFPDLFQEASRRRFADIETEAHRTFLDAVGQHSAPVGTGRILSCYSSTLATDIVARALPQDTEVALLHPTFDNIADLFRTRGLRLRPLSEDDLVQRRWPGRPVGVIAITHPNNPTGLVTPPGHLRSLAEHAAGHGQTVIVDAAFRGQVKAAQYDTYEILDAAGADWITFEDTGKLWPMHELKIGMLAFSPKHAEAIEAAFAESLLSASPAVLALIRELAKDWGDSGFEHATALIEHNRRIVSTEIGAVGLSLADPDSRVSVARVRLPDNGPDSAKLYAEMVRRGVHVLPCPPFHWADPEEGLRLIRVSLARPSDTVEAAARTLAQTFADLR